MNIEQIVSAAVEAKIKEMVERALSGNYGSACQAIEAYIQRLIDDELPKYDAQMRAEVCKLLTENPKELEIKAYLIHKMAAEI